MKGRICQVEYPGSRVWKRDNTTLIEGLSICLEQCMKLGFDVTNVVGDQPTGISQYIKKIIPAIACELNLEEKIKLFYKASRLKQFKNWWRPAGCLR